MHGNNLKWHRFKGFEMVLGRGYIKKSPEKMFETLQNQSIKACKDPFMGHHPPSVRRPRSAGASGGYYLNAQARYKWQKTSDLGLS